eukprot:TRINITY_DN11781_c0_g1_i1.p1 TRINITY_DN11781_c0_g1~~TRINITY_DN11781_c0_g1_i1.p1  ORF type:complete len:305 (+),score=80.31 TRINITY_DN11781_c0_g1_i1:220-1134(+)
MSDYEDWFDLIKNTTVRDIVEGKQRTLVSIPSTSSLGDTLALLSRENILSAPVVTGNTIRGLVDVIDIAGFLLKLWREESPYYDTAHFPSISIFNTPITEILNFSSFDPLVTISCNASVEELIKTFASPRTFNRLHRVLVLGDDGNVWNMISQSDIIVFASENMEMLPDDLLEMSLDELRAVHPVINVRIDTPFIDALELLFQNRISGLALTDQEFHLAGNLSCSDLRGIHFRSFEFFLGSVIQFQAKGTTSGTRPTISCNSGSTLAESIEMLVDNGVHRLYINDQYNRPIGILSLSDVICRLV